MGLGPSIRRIRTGAVVNSVSGSQTDQAPSVASVVTALANKADLVAGKVPSSQLPSFVDDVLESANLESFPGTGETGKIYVAIDSGKTYRWSGSAYVEISASPGSTDSVTEGATNLYHTAARAKSAAVVNSVSGSQTDQAPAVAAVVTALATKAATSHSHAISDITALQAALDGKQASDATLTALAALSYTSGTEVKTLTAADTFGTLNVGTSANNLVQLTAATKLPAVDGSLLTALNADQLTAGTLAAARLTSGSHANPVEVFLATDLALSGTSNQDMLTLAIPSTGLWIIEWQAAFGTSVSQTFTTRLITGTAAITGSTGRAVGCGFAGTAVAICTVTTGSPTVVSGRASSGTNTAQVVHLVLDVTTAGTFVLQVALNNGGGSPVAQAGTVIYGVKL